MRILQVVLSSMVIGVAGGFSTAQQSSVMGSDLKTVSSAGVSSADPARAATTRRALKKTAAADYDPMTDPVVMQQIIDLIESGQRNEALELIEKVSKGESLAPNPCVDGAWEFTRKTSYFSPAFADPLKAVDGYFDVELTLEGKLVLGGGTILTQVEGIQKATVWSYETSKDPALNPSDDGSEWKTIIPDFFATRAVKADSDGFIYAAMISNSGGSGVAKLATGGGVIWIANFPLSSSVITPCDLAIGPEGIPVVSGFDGIRQISPFTGGVSWHYNEDFETNRNARCLAVDGIGDVYIAFVDFGGTGIPGTYIAKISGSSGKQLWETRLTSAIADFVIDMQIDNAGNVVLGAVITANNWSFIGKYNADDGQPIAGWELAYTYTGANSEDRMRDMAVDRFGNSFMLVSSGFNPRVIKLTPSKSDTGSGFNEDYVLPFAGSGALISAANIGVDRGGNAYFSVSFLGNHVLARIDSADPMMLSWSCPSVSAAPLPFGLEVDGGGNLFSVIFDTTDGIAKLRKIEQTINLPLEFCASPPLKVIDHSVWPGNLGRVEDSLSIFDESWNEGITIGGFIDPWPIDDTGAALAFATSGRIQTGFKAEIEGGTVDINFPINVEWETIGDAIPANQPVNFDVSWTVGPEANLVSCSKPEFNAGITAGLDMNVFSNLGVKVFGASLLDEDLLDLQVNMPNGYIMSLGAFNDVLGLLPEGTYVKIPGLPTGISIKVRKPVLSAQSCITAIDPVNNNASFASSAKNNVAIFDFSVTNFILDRYVKGRPDLCPQPQDSTPIGKINKEICDLNRKIYTLNQKAGFSVGELGLAYRLQLLNLIIRAQFAAKQDLGAKVTPMVRYEVRDGSGVLRTGPWETVVPLDMAQNFGDIDLTVPMSSDGVLEVTPFVSATVEFDNNTGASITPGLRWETLLAKLRASAFGITIVPPFDLCLLCDDLEFFELNIPLYDEAPFIIEIKEIPMPPMRVVGIQAGGEGPALASASRTALPMVIYDQTSPSISSFNNGANGVSKMLLYGERFELPFESSVVPVVKISHHGRTEVLKSTRLNANTILCEVPNRFRLLPGVARIWVERDHLGVTQSTGTIDMPIEYPVPRLDAVNPNLWAADPDMFVVPMQVIDRKTLLGTDTFITRRDYYVKMRGELWNASSTADLVGVNLVADADGNGIVDINEVFPGFDFDAPPAFPTVLFGTQDEFGVITMSPLPVFIQPIDSGIHNVRLAERNYNRPGYIPVQVCNPGPGGGVSETLMLDIAAPVPVASELEPSEVEPGGSLRPGESELELIVRGPVHVPTWGAFEEPKFGNFNADSEVLFDGVPVPTTFVDSSELRAFVPDYMLQIAGTATVTVFTPDNGSRYLEKKWSDPDGDGVFDSPVLAEIASGGESAPVFFPIRFRQPVISEIFPPETVSGNIAYGGTAVGYPHFNVVVDGNNFRDGAVVLVDGVARETRYVDRETLSVRLLPEDIAVPGRRFISVLNPGRDGHVSEMADFMVTTPKAAVYTKMGP